MAEGLATEVLCAQGEQFILREGGSGLDRSATPAAAATAASAAAAAAVAAAATPVFWPLVAEYYEILVYYLRTRYTIYTARSENVMIYIHFSHD